MSLGTRAADCFVTVVGGRSVYDGGFRQLERGSLFFGVL